MTVDSKAIEAGVSQAYPLVERPRAVVPTSVMIGGVAVFGALLFATLEMRRAGEAAPSVAAGEQIRVAQLPPLQLPLERLAPVEPYYTREPASVARVPSRAVTSQAPFETSVTPTSAIAPDYGSTGASPPISYTAPPDTSPRQTTGPAIVFDAGQAAEKETSTPSSRSEDDPTEATSGSDRVRAGAFLNRATTVVQGTIIPAVLETAFDSTGPGFARALVQRDIRGFDGTRVLVPRGSRVIGRYRTVPSLGQSRVLITWFRLIRPDGVTIDLYSPAADSLGRGGVKASVNTHFFERFAASILQSTLDLGVALASRRADRSVVVALPGAAATVGSEVASSAAIAPTLRIRAGTSVSVFVARDLDFTAHE